jgi:murein DD-endopeptidase MepM/ murein hydrolase activator NlpD
MIKFKIVKHYWSLLRVNWKTKYRLIIRNDDSHADKISLLLSPKNVFVVVTTSSVLLIILTALLIAFTPLRVYVPGYTNPEEYRNLKKMATRIDSMELMLTQNQQYIDNFYSIINDQITTNTEEAENIKEKSSSPKELSESEKKKIAEANAEILEDADLIMKEKLSLKNSASASTPISKRANINTLLLLPPTIGAVINEYNPAGNHYGIDIKNIRSTLITSVADGIVIFSGYDPKDGNTIIIQHSGNLISVYKHTDILLKGEGYKVFSGEPIARMGNSGNTKRGVHLHFELWYNGFPVNPLDYIVVN